MATDPNEPTNAAVMQAKAMTSFLAAEDMEQEFGQILGISESGKYLMMERLLVL